MTKTLEEIIEAIKKRKTVLEEKYKVKEIGIFGSYVRGEQKQAIRKELREQILSEAIRI
jgi:hypothetical protein